MTNSEIEITAELVHDLLQEQHPDLAGLPIREVAGGWGNQMWRLGDELAVRAVRLRRLGPLRAHRGPLLPGGPTAGPGPVRPVADAGPRRARAPRRTPGTQRHPRGGGAGGAGRPPGRPGRRRGARGRKISCRPLPEAPQLPAEPGLPPSLDTEVPPAPGVDPAALEFLAAQTARAAHRMLAEALRPGHERQPVDVGLTLHQGTVRPAAGDPERSIGARLTEGSERDREGLASAVRAWRYGGPAGLAVLDEEWHVEAESLARARAALETAWVEDEQPRLRSALNRWAVIGGTAQLSLGRGGRWWPYRKERGRWAPAGPAAQDPATALASAGADAGTGTGTDD